MSDNITISFRDDSCVLSVSEMDKIVGHTGTIRLLLRLKGYPRLGMCATEIQGCAAQIEEDLFKESENA